MRNYSFANFLRELRERCGLSQYQLGQLANVSDKAVSKWENGLSVPRSATLFRLCEILGVSADELLACKYESDEVSAQKGVFAMKNKIKKALKARLHEKYGDKIHPIILNRFLLEMTEAEKGDFLLGFELLKILREHANTKNEYILLQGSIGASFLSYIYGATDISPLPPHYHCPRCKRVEFHTELGSGWDLDEQKCECGALLERDGHDIPCESYYRMLRTESLLNISVSEGFFPVAQRLFCEYFDGFKRIRIDRGIANIYTYAVITDSSSSFTDGQTLTDGFEVAFGYPRFSFSVNHDLDSVGALCNSVNKPFRRVDFLSRELLCEILKGNTDGIPQFSFDFMKNMLRDIAPTSFLDLTKILGLCHGTGTWTDNAELALRAGLPLSKTVAFRDDVYNYVNRLMSRAGISTPGLAFAVSDDARRGIYACRGIPEELRYTLEVLGAEEYFTDSISKIYYLFPKAHALVYLKYSLILMYYKLNYPKEYKEFMQ